MAFIDNLLKTFGLTRVKRNNVEIPYPAKKDPKTGNHTKKPVNYKGDIEKFLEAYMDDAYENASSVRNRFDRYNALDEMVKNDGYMNIAVEMFAYEATQADAQNNIVDIKAESGLKKWIQEQFDNWGINEQFLQDVSYNLSCFGDHFCVHDISENGISEVMPVSPYSVEERMEFNPVQIGEEMKKRGKTVLNSLGNQSSLMQKLAQYITDKKETYNLSDYFRTYLFGYSLQGGDLVLPPWMVTHFRRFTTQNEYAPYGRPLLINTLSPYKQLKYAKIIQQAMRANAFPIKIWEIDVGEDANAMDSFQAIMEFKTEIENLGKNQSEKEPIVAQPIYVPSGQAKLTVEDSRIDLDKIADIENLEQNMITSTGIPPSAILAGQGGFGNSGDAMLRQDKKFARRVYSVQTAILEGLTSLIHLQMVLTGAYDYQKANFELSMYFPVTEESSDKMRLKTDSLRLAKDILDNLGTSVGLDRGEALPIDIVKQVFSNYSFIDPEDIKKWIKSIEDMKASDEDNIDESVKNKMMLRAKALTEKECFDAYFKAKRSNGFYEGTISDQHYFTSKNISKSYKHIYETISNVYSGYERLTENDVNWKHKNKK